jgi:hypothetical protein
MSCAIDKILDPVTQKVIDVGVDGMSLKIKKAVEKNETDCRASNIDRAIAVVNIVIQYIILAFVVLALFNHAQSNLIIEVVKWTTYVSLGLLAIQYRNLAISAGRLVFALDTSTKIIIFLTVVAAFGVGFVQKGNAGMSLTTAIAMVLFIKLSLQMKDFMTDAKSSVAPFMAFVKELLTPERIKKIYGAF